eukprot:8824984-Heterocapsa_arctica.AAC.1
MLSTGRWAPWGFLPAMGRMGTAKGSPYRPITTVKAALVISHLNGGGWGPPELRPGLPAILASIEKWASKPLYLHRGAFSWVRQPKTTWNSIRELAQTAAGRHPPRELLKRAAPHIYSAVWWAVEDQARQNGADTASL